ncbi:MAG TPA: FIST N-terminal domain-containing protein [Bryobacteraceae bacterium]|nr:FIST N-terminal domain-containing protein [Bryobacteraceae bacterium]
MTQSSIVQTGIPDSEKAGTSLGEQVCASMGSERPDAVVLFASPVYDHSTLLRAFSAACKPKLVVGCSTAGEFVNELPSSSSACAVAIRSADLSFGAGIARNLAERRESAAQEMVSTFKGTTASKFRYRSVLLLSDVLAGYIEEFLDQLTLTTAGRYQIFGGGAGDDAKFTRTHVFYGEEAVSDAAVGLEILSNKPLGIGVSHGWQAATAPMRVTDADGMRLVSLNAVPAAEIFEEYAESKGQRFDRAAPLPFFLHNILGIDTGAGFKLRVPLSVEPDGSIRCAAEIPAGSTISIMSAPEGSAADAAGRAVRAALGQLQSDSPPAVALFFDCTATRLRMGTGFGVELAQIADALSPTRFVGCNTYGQIARVEGQFSGFHNCTAVICIIP